MGSLIGLVILFYGLIKVSNWIDTPHWKWEYYYEKEPKPKPKKVKPPKEVLTIVSKNNKK